jgi:DNA invertase Pin-like site-specific DNA recombinase
VDEAGHEVGETFVDDGKSAWNPRVRRPEWEALMARLESGASAGVCVYDLSRFARQVKDGERLIDAAERGLIVLDSESNQSFDLTSPGGKKAFRDAINAAAYYSDRTSKTGKRGKALRAQEGLSHGGPRPFGFEKDGMTTRDAEAEILRDWAARVLKGESLWSLVRDAAARGILTSVGTPWRHQNIRSTLMRERNAGIIVHNGEPVATMPGKPILDRPTYDKLIALFEGRRRGRPSSYVCSGQGFAVCGVCGNPLHGRPRSHHKAYDDGEPKREYWCSPANGGCSGSSIDQRELDEWAADFAIRTLSDPQHRDAVAKRAAEMDARVAELDRESSDIEAILDDLNAKLTADLPNAVRAGRADKVRARHASLTAPLEKRLAEIGPELEALASESATPEPGTRTIPERDQAYLYWLDLWDTGETGERRPILARALAGRVIVVSPYHDLARTPRIQVRAAK